jgi:hypothetical protein
VRCLGGERSRLAYLAFKTWFWRGLIEKLNKCLFSFFGCAAWCHWLIRNDFVFNNVVISSPEVCLFRFISYMQRWEILCKGKKQLQVDEAIQRLKLHLSSLQSNT